MQPRTVYQLEVNPKIPARLARLEELAYNLWYSWDRPTRTLFSRLHPGLWDAVGHNPKAFLRRVDEQLLVDAADDPVFLGNFNRVLSAYDTYHNEPLRRNGSEWLRATDLVAYFCAEFGFHESLPIYSGGLGILAGDHCKAASDMRLPFVGVGLLYRQGYFSQTIDTEGNQHAVYTDSDFESLPVTPVRRADGSEVKVYVTLPGRRVTCKVWQARCGHVTLYLLDTDLEENAEQDATSPTSSTAATAPPASSRRSCSASAACARWRRWGSSPPSGTSTKAMPRSWCWSACARWPARPGLRRRARGGRGEHRLHHAHAGAGGARSFRRGHDLELFPGLLPGAGAERARTSSRSAASTTAANST